MAALPGRRRALKEIVVDLFDYAVCETRAPKCKLSHFDPPLGRFRIPTGPFMIPEASDIYCPRSPITFIQRGDGYGNGGANDPQGANHAGAVLLATALCDGHPADGFQHTDAL